MVANKFLSVLAIAAAALLSTPANAQRVIVAGEPPAADGTYCNIMANPASTSAIAYNALACGLLGNSILRIQGASGFIVPSSGSQNPSGVGSNSLSVQTYMGGLLTTNVSANTVITAVASRFFKVSVLVAGTTTGAVHNTTTTGGAAASNLVAVIPNAVGVYDYNFPMSSGIVYIAGTGQVVAISYQ